MATLAETTLIRVKTISKKHLTQIRLVPYDWNEGSLHKQLYMGLLDDTVTALGFVPASQVAESRRSLGDLWLVRRKTEFYLFCPPDKGPLFDHWNPGLEQLFVD